MAVTALDLAKIVRRPNKQKGGWAEGYPHNHPGSTIHYFHLSESRAISSVIGDREDTVSEGLLSLC